MRYLCHPLTSALMAGETATVADGTYPTGMHFCLDLLISNFHE